MAQEARPIATQEMEQARSYAQVIVKNRTMSDMRLVRSHNWAGKPGNLGIPQTISPAVPAVFGHEGNIHFRSKAAVVYEGKNMVGGSCSWVLAWDGPSGNNTPHKVYVTCGPSRVIEDMKFADIQFFLDRSEDKSNAEDPSTKTNSFAAILDLAPKAVTVDASFSITT